MVAPEYPKERMERMLLSLIKNRRYQYHPLKYAFISAFSIASLVFESYYEQGDGDQSGSNKSGRQKKEVRLEIIFVCNFFVRGVLWLRFFDIAQWRRAIYVADLT